MPRFLLLGSLLLAGGLLTACGGSGSPAPAPAPAVTVNPVDQATAGAVVGRVSFEGTAPAPQPISMKSDPNCQPEPGATSETVLVGTDGSLQNVFVYVKVGLGDLTFPVPTTPVVLTQRKCRYEPHVLGIQVGQPLDIINGDATLHNVHGMGTSNREFNAGQPNEGMKLTQTFTATEVLVPDKCDVQKWMNAWVGVVDHPFYAVTGPDGAFELKGLPAGAYTIEAVHERFGVQTMQVTVGQKATATAAFTFTS